MALRGVVHASGVVRFASLPGDAYEFRVDYEQAQGRVWLKSSRTEREWLHVIDNRAAFAADPSFRDQFTVEITLFELALQYDPRVHKTDACKNVVLSRAHDDLVLQLSQRVYTRRNPAWGPPIQFTLEWVRGSGTLPHGMSRDPPTPLPLPEPPRPKVPREEQQKDTIARLREENKALKAAKRDRAGDSRLYKADNEALRREVQQLKAANDAQYAELIKLGSSHEFQRQHIEHLRRKIQALQQQLAAVGQQPLPHHHQPNQQHHHPLPPPSSIEPPIVSAITDTESDPLGMQVTETSPGLAALEPQPLDQDIHNAISEASGVNTADGSEPNKRRRTSAD